MSAPVRRRANGVCARPVQMADRRNSGIAPLAPSIWPTFFSGPFARASSVLRSTISCFLLNCAAFWRVLELGPGPPVRAQPECLERVRLNRRARDFLAPPALTTPLSASSLRRRFSPPPVRQLAPQAKQ
eukprot:1373377-Pyramimonas_sp.AAC.2